MNNRSSVATIRINVLKLPNCLAYSSFAVVGKSLHNNAPE